jgi:hypothetical protein
MEAKQVERIVNEPHNKFSHLAPVPTRFLTVADRSVLHEEAFRRMLSLERKRTERSRKLSLLALLEINTPVPSEKTGMVLDKILSALASTTRETDVTGWYQRDRVVGALFTEVTVEDRRLVVATIKARLSQTLRFCLTAEQFSQVGVSFQVSPAERDNKIMPRPSLPPVYAGLVAAD